MCACQWRIIPKELLTLIDTDGDAKWDCAMVRRSAHGPHLLPKPPSQSPKQHVGCAAAPRRCALTRRRLAFQHLFTSPRVLQNTWDPPPKEGTTACDVPQPDASNFETKSSSAGGKVPLFPPHFNPCRTVRWRVTVH